MAKRVQALARHLVEEYGGDAAKVWTTAPDGHELLRRVRALPGFGQQKAKIFIALLGKQLGLNAAGWVDVASPFGHHGTHLSIADIDGPESLALVRQHKKEMKAAAKRAAPAAKAAVKKAVPAGKAVAKKVPAGKAVAKKVPAGKAVAKKVPAGKAVAKKVPATKTATKKVPATKTAAVKSTVIKKATQAKKATAARTTKKAAT
jgi:hypothetical protein